MNMEKLYTPDEVADVLKIKSSTVKQWLRAGTLSGIKVSRSWRVKESDLKRFIEKGA